MFLQIEREQLPILTQLLAERVAELDREIRGCREAELKMKLERDLGCLRQMLQ